MASEIRVNQIQNRSGQTTTTFTDTGVTISGILTVSHDLNVGGVVTYEDVTNIDSVGIITAQKDIHVGAGVSAVGVGTFGSLDIGGDIDVDGHTNLDNVSVAGVTTFSDNLRIIDGKKFNLEPLKIQKYIIHQTIVSLKIKLVI